MALIEPTLPIIDNIGEKVHHPINDRDKESTTFIDTSNSQTWKVKHKSKGTSKTTR